jgi:hypothetical protein
MNPCVHAGRAAVCSLAKDGDALSRGSIHAF